jgi:hypothetical protein
MKSSIIGTESIFYHPSIQSLLDLYENDPNNTNTNKYTKLTDIFNNKIRTGTFVNLFGVNALSFFLSLYLQVINSAMLSLIR